MWAAWRLLTLPDCCSGVAVRLGSNLGGRPRFGLAPALPEPLELPVDR